MRYLPHTETDIREMLEVCGVSRLQDLFQTIPEKIRLKKKLDLPPPLSEIELREHLRDLSRRNAHGDDWSSFLGGGLYSHYTPSPVASLVQRGEFLTAYTPYQPEVSQGTLQAIFEYQTMVAEILGMEIANASVYDGSTGTAEAVLMALRMGRGNKVLVSRLVHPEYRQVLSTYLKNQDVEVVEIPSTAAGTVDPKSFDNLLDEKTACVVMATPNFFGVAEDLTPFAEAAHKAGAFFIITSPEPLSFGLFKSPGEMGADIAVAEGQGFGNSLNLGGPSLGFFATRQKHARALPGRLVGETTDQEGRRGYVLTLATREQHIRRERATSNICTNVSLCALAATIHLALLGREGFQRLARLNFDRAADLRRRLSKISGVHLPFSGTVFNEFVIRTGTDSRIVLERMRGQKIHAGIPIDRWYPELENGILVAVTEMNSEKDRDRLVEELKKILED